MSSLYAAVTIGVLLRLFVAGTIPGYVPDIQTFTAWAHTAASQGLFHFYSQGMFADYPPGYMYVLYLIGGLQRYFQIPFDSSLMLTLLKLPAILADAVSAYLLFRLGRTRCGNHIAFGLAVLYLFHPAVMTNSSAWGQVDSIFMLGVLLLLTYLVDEKLTSAFITYAVILAVKPQALLLAPLLLMYLLGRRRWDGVGIALVKGIGMFGLIVLPFALQQEPLWIAKLYAGTLSSYPYASLNAYNLHTLLGGNFAPMQESLLGLTYQWWGMLCTAAVIGYACVLYGKGERTDVKLPLLAALMLTGIFLFMPKMHERYLFYALLPCLLSLIYSKDRRLLYVFLGLGATHYVNVAQVLYESYREVYFIPKRDPVLLIVSAANVALFAYLCRVSWSLLVKGNHHPLLAADNIAGVPQRKSERAGKHAAAPVTPGSHKLRWSSKDNLLLTGLVVVYIALSLFQLGSARLPSTYWKPASAGASVVADLGERRSIDRITLLPGIGEGSFSIAFSEDGKQWTEGLIHELTVYQVFSWQVTAPGQAARYIRIDAQRPGFTLFEVAMYEPGKISPIGFHHSGEGAALFDEPGKAAYRSTYMNGMYFDEIYHARTAYEHLQGWEPYESTHPPLGKWLIAAGIKLFGMNPLGWRIPGVLFGAAMLPVMYLFGKRMFGSSEYAFVAAMLLGFDGLHFVQSRIATIDVYAVFFIMLMFYFMYRYCTFSFYEMSLRRTLLPLAASGLCFGLGVATKWISLYAGVGLAVLFFLSLYLRYREYRTALELLSSRSGRGGKREEKLTESLEHKVRVFPRHALITITWCVCWFIAVPTAVYVASYLPWLLLPGSGHTFAELVSYQKHMLGYHAGLQSTHPFSSSWWQWPLMNKPVWYYAGAEVPVRHISSIVAIGNPLVWWAGMACMLAVLVIAWRKRRWIPVFLTVAFFSQYVPWMFVSRVTFLYHYFAMVPFCILAITYIYKLVKESFPDKRRYLQMYLVSVVAVFFLFYPVLTGMTIPRAYAEHVLQWSKQWIFF